MNGPFPPRGGPPGLPRPERSDAAGAWHPPAPALGRNGLPPLDPHGGPRAGEGLGAAPSTPLDFSTNIVPFPPDPEVLEAARSAPLDRYPDPVALAGRKALARHWECDPERLLLAPGGSELLHRVAHAFLRPGDRVLVLGSTFGEYARAAGIRGARVEHLGRGVDQLPASSEAEARVAAAAGERGSGPLRLVFLCSPNNPTGDAWSEAEVRGLAAHIPPGCLLVLDESYASFPARGLVPPHLPGHDPVLHIRSLTKDLALPGLRVAVAEGDPRVLEILTAVAPPWPISTPALAAVEAAVRPGPLARLTLRLAETARLRASLARELERRGWSPRPSCTGFLLVPIPPGLVAPAARVARRLEELGVRVRDATSFGLPGHLRIGTRTAADNARLLEALEMLGRPGGADALAPDRAPDSGLPPARAPGVHRAAPPPPPRARPQAPPDATPHATPGATPRATPGVMHRSTHLPPHRPTVLLIRHGATPLNEARRFQGWIDASLSEAGRREVEALAQGWETRFGPRPTRVWTSDLARAVETARLLFPRARHLPDPRLRELNFGAFEGRTADEAAREDPGAWEGWLADPDGAPPPGGEGLAHFRERVGSWLESVLAQGPPGGQGPREERGPAEFATPESAPLESVGSEDLLSPPPAPPPDPVLVVVAHGGTLGEILRRLGREDLSVPAPGGVVLCTPRDAPAGDPPAAAPEPASPHPREGDPPDPSPGAPP
jgi:histidinol-phosphate/aromatic aminotransferase/cobyric acid decarboxylase-like protein/broad specificity phosphatase PhoE